MVEQWLDGLEIGHRFQVASQGMVLSTIPLSAGFSGS
jgi:hypothetical protein